MNAKKMRNQMLRIKAVAGTMPKGNKKTGVAKTKAVKGAY